MEPQQQQQHANGGFVCGRQSSTRWTPTTEQIRILKELYYNNGVRSPSADQIQRISARLRQYGKIEGKNVFYWFQNHKARERQKKRFTSTTDDHHPLVVPCMQTNRPNNSNTSLSNGGRWKPDHHASSHLHNNYPNITHGS